MKITVLEESSNSANKINADGEALKFSQFKVQELVDWCNENVQEQIEQRPPYFLQSELIPEIPEAMKMWLNRLQDGDALILIQSYKYSIRGKLLSDHELIIRGVPILQHYELLLSRHLHDRSTRLPFDGNITPMLMQISRDILSLTRSQYGNTIQEGHDYIVRTIVIPTLLRITETILITTRGMDALSLARIVALLLSFSHDRMNSLVLVPYLGRQDLMENCSIPMNTSLPCELNPESNLAELDAKYWKDKLAVQAASSCWKAMSMHMKLSIPASEDLSKVVCREIEWETIAKAVRAQFFGKENDEGVVVKPSKNKLTYPLSVTTPLPTKPAFQNEQGRIHAAMAFVKELEMSSKVILSHMLPVCYALIDSSSPEFVSLGCAALVVLLESHEQVDDWKDFEDTLFSVLQIAATAVADPVAVRHVCLACSKACQVLPHRKKERRRLLYRFFELVSYKIRNRADENGLLRGIITAALIPLLNQSKHNAEAMELGRRGLQILLPLIRWEFGLPGRKLQVVALVALINLLVAAYPIMPHHGGKIAAALMACWGHAQRSLQDSKNRIGEEEEKLCAIVLALSTHASALALIFCGERARAIIIEIQSSSFAPSMVEHAAEVEKCHKQLQCRVMDSASTLGK